LKKPTFTLRKCIVPFTSGVLSAEPEMFTRVLTESDKFLIFASGGLWEFLSNEQAAEIVQKNPRNLCIYPYLCLVLLVMKIILCCFIDDEFESLLFYLLAFDLVMR